MFQSTIVGLLNVEVIDPKWSTEYIYDFELDKEYVGAMKLSEE